MNPQRRTASVITFLVGLLFVAAGLYIYIYMGRYIETVREASGVVVDLVYESGTRKGRIQPAVRFRTADGQEIVGRSREHHNVQLGQTVQFLYDPSHPGEIEIGTLARVKRKRVLFTMLSVLVGLLVCVMAVGFDAETLEWRLRAQRR